VRIYLPAASTLLRAWDAAGTAEPVDAIVYAVTPALREAYRDGDTEELEWVAQVAAGTASLRRLAADPRALPLRIVVAADVADSAALPGRVSDHPAALRLAGGVPRNAWASLLADDPQAADDQRQVAAAAEALRGGDVPGESPAELLEDVEAIELGWFGIQELPALLGPR
jgi:hypothetical protein